MPPLLTPMPDDVASEAPAAPAARERSGLDRVLVDLERRVPDLQGTVLASRDGISLATTFGASETDTVAAMAASVIGLAEQILPDAELDGPSTTVVRGGAGCLVVRAAGPVAVLAARTGPRPNLGLVAQELPRAVADLHRALTSC